MTRVFGVDLHLPYWATVSLLACAGLVVGWALAGGILRLALRGAAAGAASPLADAFLRAVGRPARLALGIGCAWLLVSASGVPMAERSDRLLGKGATLVLIVLFVAAGLRLASRFVPAVATQYDSVRPASRILGGIGRVLVLAIGGLMALDMAGISIGPILATLGIGSLAVALALNETLSNFFAGLYLLADRPIRPGDHVKLESGDEGQVEWIGWRSTRIKSPAGNLLVVPNAKLAQSSITNYDLPEERLSVALPVGVSRDADPDRIEAVLVEVATAAAADVPGLLPEPAPLGRFSPGFGDSSLDFTLIVHVRSYADQAPVLATLRKRVLARFRQEGIALSLPQRVITRLP